jgi:hypothetical protein
MIAGQVPNRGAFQVYVKLLIFSVIQKAFYSLLGEARYDSGGSRAGVVDFNHLQFNPKNEDIPHSSG